MNHIPVMIDKVLDYITGDGNNIYIDCTFGAGGYSEQFLLKNDSCRVIALDRDISVVPFANVLRDKYGDRFQFFHENFANLDQILEKLNLLHQVDSIVMDLGFSSMQVDNAERGFSFIKDGPLDMRMNCTDSIRNAADFVNHATKEKIINVLRDYGEERHCNAIAKAIIEQRAQKKFETTLELANLIENLFGRRGKIHPATKTFQALRIYVNNEVDNLIQGIIHAASGLNDKGRLIIVSFHGLECRVIKHVFRAFVSKKNEDLNIDWSIINDYKFRIITKKAIIPSDAEIKGNIRSRSAKMRILEKYKI